MDDLLLPACDGCADGCASACAQCEPFRVSGGPDAARECFLRLTDLGWRIHTEQVEVAPDVWHVQVQRPSR